MADFDRAFEAVEAIYLQDLMDGHDPSEGLTAFMEKRTPDWAHQ
jgi:1,4-dihydroxy-2-naphthoyl-CoA synthase